MRISDWSSDVCSSDLPERADLRLVGEEDVDMVLDQLAKGGTMAIDAERVGERQRHLAAGLAGDRRGLEERLLGQRRVQIGRAAGRGRGWQCVSILVGAGALKKKKKQKVRINRN